MLRISPMDSLEGTVTLRLEGRAIGPWVTELRRACEQVLASGCKLTLDLSDVSFFDRNAVEFAHSLRKHDVALLNCSPFIAEQLKG